MEADVHAQGVDGLVAHAHGEVGRYVAGYLLAVGILADGTGELGVELLLQLAHGALDKLMAEDGVGGLGWQVQLLGVDVVQVVGEVANRRSLVHRLVFQAHAGLELILGREVPAAGLEVNSDDWREAYAALVAAQLYVCGVGLRGVEHSIKGHVAHLDVAHVAIVVT